MGARLKKRVLRVSPNFKKRSITVELLFLKISLVMFLQDHKIYFEVYKDKKLFNHATCQCSQGQLDM